MLTKTIKLGEGNSSNLLWRKNIDGLLSHYV